LSVVRAIGQWGNKYQQLRPDERTTDNGRTNMDTLLVVITALSFAMTVGLALIVMKLVREEQRRSDARVSMLAELAAEPLPAEMEAEPHPVLRLAPEPYLSRAANAPPARELSSSAGARRDFDVRSEPAVDELELRPESTVVGVAELFAPAQSASPAGRRFAVAAALAVVVFGTGIVLLSMRSPAAAPAAKQANAVAVPPASPSAPTLELLSLRYTQHDGSLTVTGLVQNPHGGGSVSRVAAVVFLFGPDGAFLTSGRAALDFTTLSPGDESPFVVTVPVTGQVSRYRVGFRAEDGAVIGHVDKRRPEALASTAGS
jgi:hypothetical protein